MRNSQIKFLARLAVYFLLGFLMVNLYNFWPIIFNVGIPVPTKDLETRNPVQISVATPTQLIIPNLGVEAKILPVGVAKNGNLDVPNSLKNLGWYKKGPRPGEIGNAVIDGHQVDSFGLGVVFKNLYLLKPGDSIFIKTLEGENLEFEVVKVETYKYDQAPLADIFGLTDRKNLNLITCDGNWISNLKIKDKRLVVYSTLKI